MLEYGNIKTFLQKVSFQIGLKKFVLLKNLKMPCRGSMSFMTYGIVGTFYEKKNAKKKIKKSLGLRK